MRKLAIESKLGGVIATQVVIGEEFADFSNHIFRNASLRSGDFHRCRFDGSIFVNGDFRDASFDHSSFRGANLLSCDLSRAKLDHCDLSTMRLTMGSLEGATLYGSCLVASVLMPEEGLTLDQLTDALIDDSARLNTKENLATADSIRYAPRLGVEHEDPVIRRLACALVADRLCQPLLTRVFEFTTSDFNDSSRRSTYDEIGTHLNSARKLLEEELKQAYRDIGLSRREPEG